MYTFFVLIKLIEILQFYTYPINIKNISIQKNQKKIFFLRSINIESQ